MSIKLKIKKGDTVAIRTGKDAGKTGKVLAVFPEQERVMVEGLNIVHKHTRAARRGQQGQRVSMSAPLPVGRVMLVCPSCKKNTRVQIDNSGATRVRVCKKCETVIK